jgi:hypothetical protein
LKIRKKRREKLDGKSGGEGEKVKSKFFEIIGASVNTISFNPCAFLSSRIYFRSFTALTRTFKAV